MPTVRVELFPGRDAATKKRIAKAFTDALEDIAGITPSATQVVFTEVAPSDWFVAGGSYGAPPPED